MTLWPSFLTALQGRKRLDIGVDRRDIIAGEFLEHAEGHDVADNAAVWAPAALEHCGERRFGRVAQHGAVITGRQVGGRSGTLTINFRSSWEWCCRSGLN